MIQPTVADIGDSLKIARDSLRPTRIQLMDITGVPRDIVVKVNPGNAAIAAWVAAWKANPEGRGPSSHWKWHLKQLLAPADFHERFLALVESGSCHGLMRLLWPKASRAVSGAYLMYVDYLEVAPWNRPGSHRILRGAGAALLSLAIVESRMEGLDGRIGLHSLESAEPFYRRLGMMEYGADPSYDDLVYFER